MIPKASQRGGGQDLATHLLNAFDNEYVELAGMRGAVAPDLHGAFAEWEAIAAALTKCDNYLYSLSINPDHRQGPLTREQYADYADRAEKALGLTGQPRAMVVHIKDWREHCHVVWSRIDAQAGKAVHIAFDRQKLMMVTREFARDHGLKLPAGYERNAAAQERNRQLSLYEKEQQRRTGISKEQRIEEVTDAWRRSDTPTRRRATPSGAASPSAPVSPRSCANSCPRIFATGSTGCWTVCVRLATACLALML